MLFFYFYSFHFRSNHENIAYSSHRRKSRNFRTRSGSYYTFIFSIPNRTDFRQNLPYSAVDFSPLRDQPYLRHWLCKKHTFCLEQFFQYIIRSSATRTESLLLPLHSLHNRRTTNSRNNIRQYVSELLPQAFSKKPLPKLLRRQKVNTTDKQHRKQKIYKTVEFVWNSKDFTFPVDQ